MREHAARVCVLFHGVGSRPGCLSSPTICRRHPVVMFPATTRIILVISRSAVGRSRRCALTHHSGLHPTDAGAQAAHHLRRPHRGVHRTRQILTPAPYPPQPRPARPVPAHDTSSAVRRAIAAKQQQQRRAVRCVPHPPTRPPTAASIQQQPPPPRRTSHPPTHPPTYPAARPPAQPTTY